MSDPQGKPWSNNPNAPKILRNLYLNEKADFAGTLIATILYGMINAPQPTSPSIRAQFVRFIAGMIIVVFFRCMAALFNPIYRKGEPVKWWLVCYTVAMFSVTTVLTGVNIDLLSIAYIDDRKFPGSDGKLPPGPYGYQLFISPGALNVTTNVMFSLGNWLADGLLVSSLSGAAFTHTSNPGVFPSSTVAT